MVNDTAVAIRSSRVVISSPFLRLPDQVGLSPAHPIPEAEETAKHQQFSTYIRFFARRREAAARSNVARCPDRKAAGGRPIMPLKPRQGETAPEATRHRRTLPGSWGICGHGIGATALGLHSRACIETGNNRSHPPWAAFHWPPSAASPAAFFHNAGDTYRKATLTRPKPCRTAIQIGDNTRGMVESDIAAFATLVRTKLCYRCGCGVREGMVKFNNPGGMVIVGV